MLLIRWRLILKPTLLPVRKLEGPQKIIIILDVRKLKGLKYFQNPFKMRWIFEIMISENSVWKSKGANLSWVSDS